MLKRNWFDIFCFLWPFIIMAAGVWFVIYTLIEHNSALKTYKEDYKKEVKVDKDTIKKTH